MEDQLITNLTQEAEKAFGFLPNLFLEIVKSPAAAETYLHGTKTLKSLGSLTGPEQQVVYLAISAWYECNYCLPAHRTFGKWAQVPQSEMVLISRRQLPTDPRFRALSATVWKLLDANGKPTADDIREIEDSGVTRQAIYDIIAMIGMKVITIWINHIGTVNLDPILQPALLEPDGIPVG
jgi:alkylhydroperoxidase family enzyme